MNKLTLLLKYWFSRIIWPAIRTSFSFNELGSKLLGIAIELLVAAILVFGLGLPGQVPGSGEVAESVLAVVLVLIVAGLLRILWNVIYLPAKIYNEQGGFIENPFEVTAFETDYANGDPHLVKERYASVLITNKFPLADIDDCWLVLKSILNLKTKETRNFSNEVLLWSGREHVTHAPGEQALTIRYGSPRVCDIAVRSEDRVFVTTRFGYGAPIFELKEGNYRVTVEAVGKLKDRPLDVSYLVDVSYQEVMDFFPIYQLKIDRIMEKPA